MNSDNRRIFIAGLLIFLVLLLQPYYYKWLGIEPSFTEEDSVLKVVDVKPVVEAVDLKLEEGVAGSSIQKDQETH